MKKYIILFISILLAFSFVSCNKQAHTVTFESNGGTACASIMTKGKEVLSLPSPTRNGYTFDGWYYDNGVFNKAFLSESLVDYDLEEDVTVYAKWIKDRAPGGETIIDLSISDVSDRPTPSITYDGKDAEYVCYISKSAPLSAVYSTLSYTVDKWLYKIGLPLEKPETYVGSEKCTIQGNLYGNENIIRYTVSSGSDTHTLAVQLYLSEGSQVGEYRLLKHNDRAIILNYTGSSSVLNIPQSIEDLSVGYISPLAFFDNKNLSEITLPKTVSQIGECCFAGCTSLNSIIVSENNNTYTSAEGWLYDKSKTTLLCATNNTRTATVPSGIKYIAAGCFSDRNVVSVDTSNAEYIGMEAFKNCSRLETITLSDSLKYVSEGMMYGTAVTTLALPASAQKVGDYAFASCTKLQAANVSSATSLGEGAFYGCTKMAGLVVGNLSAIPASCFENCNTLYAITIPTSVKVISDYAFRSCSLLSSVSFENDSLLTAVGKSAFSGCSSLSTVSLPQTVQEIGSSAFQNSGITSFDFPTRTVTVQSSLFNNCSKLDSVQLEGIITIEANAFAYSTLKTLTLPSTLQTIQERAFYACEKIPNTFIPSSVLSIGRNAFSKCTSLVLYVNALSAPAQFDSTWCGNSTVYYGIEQVGDENGCQFYTDTEKATLTKYTGSDKNPTIPNTLGGKPLKNIGKGAFSNCEIESVIFSPDSLLTDVGEKCFFECTLQSITLPASLRNIGEQAFAHSSLNAVSLSEVDTIGKFCFLDCTQLANVTLSALTMIPEGAFQECTFLTEIIIPNTVTTIGDSAFDRCTSLSTVTFDGCTPETLGNACFKQCTSLISVALPSSVKAIPSSCFFWCTSLVTINLTDVESIGEQAFRGCQKLEYTLGNKLATIDRYAFWNTESTKSVTLTSNIVSIKDNAFGNTESVQITIECMFSTKPEGFSSSWYGANCKINWH